MLATAPPQAKHMLIPQVIFVVFYVMSSSYPSNLVESSIFLTVDNRPHPIVVKTLWLNKPTELKVEANYVKKWQTLTKSKVNECCF